MLVFILLYLSMLQTSSELQSSITRRIIGGKPTTIEKHPYQLSFRLDNKHICGAALIQRDIGVTAAHCVERMVTIGYSVRAGSIYHRIGGLVVPVRKILIHKHFNMYPVIKNDVAVIKLSRQLPLSSKIQLIALPASYGNIKAQMQALTAGWGHTDNNDELSNVLRSTKITIVSKQLCNITYNTALSPEVFCALAARRDTAKGDSGGAVVFDGKIIGITSFGARSETLVYPSVYTDITASLNILNKMLEKL